MIQYNKPLTYKQLIEYLELQPQNELVWINDSFQYICIGHQNIIDSTNPCEYEFLYVKKDYPREEM